MKKIIAIKVNEEQALFLAFCYLLSINVVAGKIEDSLTITSKLKKMLFTGVISKEETKELGEMFGTLAEGMK